MGSLRALGHSLSGGMYALFLLGWQGQEWWSGWTAADPAQGHAEPAWIGLTYILNAGLSLMVLLRLCLSGWLYLKTIHPGPGVDIGLARSRLCQGSAEPRNIDCRSIPLTVGCIHCFSWAGRARCGSLAGQQQTLPRAMQSVHGLASPVSRVLGCL